MFGTILISFISLIHLYVFWRLAATGPVTQLLSRKIIIGIGLGLWLLFVFARLYGHNRTGKAAAALEFLGMNWMGMLFLLFIALLAADVVTGFGFLLPRVAPTLRGWALLAGVLLSAVALFQGMRPPVIRNHEVHLAGLSPQLEGTVLVAISDLHLGTVLGPRWLAARVAQLQAMQPHLVVLLGDIFEGQGPPADELQRIMQRISPPLGVWGVTGNHEFHGSNDGNSGNFKAAGIQLLRNRSVQIAPGLILAGVDDLTRLHRSGGNADPIEQALAGRPAGTTIFLSHTPWQTEKAAAAQVDLMLSGHTHGGQIWPFGYLVRRVYPLLAGRYQVDGMAVIVCRGTGTWGPRMRLWHPAEILRITLRAGDKLSP